MTDDAPKAAAGWYPQPDGSKRFWDGDQWLDVPDPTAASRTSGDTDPEYQAELAKARADVKAESKADAKRGWIIILVVVALIGGCSYFASRGGSSSEYDEYDAWQNCKAQMDKSLKAPGTAGYPLVSELDWSNSGTVWTFDRAWVDAENSFGAKVRTYFDCTVTETGTDTVSVKVTPLS